MSVVLKPAVECFSFDGESVGAAGAAALRKVKSLAESAPQGRLFSAISTLVDTSSAAAAQFEAAGLAELRAETSKAEMHLNRGTGSARKLKASIGVEVATPLPAFMRRRSSEA